MTISDEEKHKLKQQSHERFWTQVEKAAREGTLRRLSLPANAKPRKFEPRK